MHSNVIDTNTWHEQADNFVCLASWSTEFDLKEWGSSLHSISAMNPFVMKYEQRSFYFPEGYFTGNNLQSAIKWLKGA